MATRKVSTLAFILLAAVAIGGADASTHGTNDPTVIARILEYHNSVRAQHGAGPLSWDATIAQSAQSWTDQCNFSHDGTQLNQLGYGENLAEGYAEWQQAVGAWTAEGAQYDYSNPGYSASTGHFTQVVWKSTTSVGCATTPGCSGGTIYSCRYSPAGNYIGQFPQNVS